MSIYTLRPASTKAIGYSGADLVVDDATGFEVDDSLIIESQHGYNEDGYDGNWPREGSPYPFYYGRAFKRGKSFIGTIRARNGNTLTMDRSLPSDPAGMYVYRNNALAFERAIERGDPFPREARYAVSSPNPGYRIRPLLTNDYAETDFNGCEVFSPAGAVPVYINPERLASGRSSLGPVSNKLWKNLRIRSNWRKRGYGPSGGFSLLINGDGASPPSSNWVVDNFSFTDVYAGMKFQNISDAFASNCRATWTDEQMEYLLWEWQCVDAVRCTYVNCTNESRFAKTGYQAFKSTGVNYFDIRTRNVVCAINASGCVLVKNYTVDWDARDTPWIQAQNSNFLMGANRTIEQQQGFPIIEDDTFGGTGLRDITFNIRRNTWSANEDRCIGGIYAEPRMEVRAGVPVDLDVRGVEYNVHRTDIAPLNDGYVVRAGAQETFVDGITGDTLDTGNKVLIED